MLWCNDGSELPVKARLLSGTMIPAFVIGIGLAASGGVLPEAVPLGASPAFAQCSACNPCAAAACNPCAAAACNPCAAATCNPCAAAACNPCAAACNPCNPCNPCAGGGGAMAVPTDCDVPRLVTAAACNPCAAAACNPCAAAACNPCAAAACNPCAAAACNPCAAACNPCNPCNPCAAGGGVDLTDAEALAAYDCAKATMKAGYVKSSLASAGGLEIASGYQGWSQYSTRAYQSATHGARQVQNYANVVAAAYGKYEESGPMPVGSILAKDSFLVKNGKVMAGPLFVMEKMPAGFNEASGNWRYTMVTPTGAIFGVTNGVNSKGMEFCIECHAAMADNDHMFFLPEEYRVR